MYFPIFRFFGILNVAIPSLFVLILYVFPLNFTLTVCFLKAFPLEFKTLTLNITDFLTFLTRFLVIKVDFIVILFLTIIF